MSSGAAQGSALITSTILNIWYILEHFLNLSYKHLVPTYFRQLPFIDSINSYLLVFLPWKPNGVNKILALRKPGKLWWLVRTVLYKYQILSISCFNSSHIFFCLKYLQKEILSVNWIVLSVLHLGEFLLKESYIQIHWRLVSPPVIKLESSLHLGYFNFISIKLHMSYTRGVA